MEKQKTFILTKDLPSCQKGKIFKSNDCGDFFLSMTDDEFLKKDLKSYDFTKEQIENNPDWFLDITNGKKENTFYFTIKNISNKDNRISLFGKNMWFTCIKNEYSDFDIQIITFVNGKLIEVKLAELYLRALYSPYIAALNSKNDLFVDFFTYSLGAFINKELNFNLKNTDQKVEISSIGNIEINIPKNKIVNFSMQIKSEFDIK